jgi:hypothetical protein
VSGAYKYCVYGITVTSDIPLALPEHADGHLAAVEIRTAPASFFAEAIRGAAFATTSDEWFQYAPLPDGSSYVSTTRVGEFLVSADGRRIFVRQFLDTSNESFQVYMLGRAISFALVKRGFEPLHATVAVIDGQAVAFLGESGFGKSSLAASFIHAGFPILTDDLLILQQEKGDRPLCPHGVAHAKSEIHERGQRSLSPFSSGILAYPGPPRIKVFANIARRFLGSAANGVPMNPDTQKLILPLRAEQGCSTAMPLAAIYTLAAPHEVSRKSPIEIAPLSPRDSFLELVKNTFNYRLVNAQRLERQFVAGAHIATSMPVRQLSYPRVLRRLPEVRDAVIADLRSLKKANREAAA